MAKVVLSIKEVNQIVVDVLASKGLIERGKVANITWDVDRFTPVVSAVTIEQDEEN